MRIRNQKSIADRTKEIYRCIVNGEREFTSYHVSETVKKNRERIVNGETNENEILRITGRTTRIIAEFLAMHERYNFEDVLVVGHHDKRSGDRIINKILKYAGRVKDGEFEKMRYIHDLPNFTATGAEYLQWRSLTGTFDYIVKDHPMP